MIHIGKMDPSVYNEVEPPFIIFKFIQVSGISLLILFKRKLYCRKANVKFQTKKQRFYFTYTYVCSYRLCIHIYLHTQTIHMCLYTHVYP